MIIILSDITYACKYCVIQVGMPNTSLQLLPEAGAKRRLEAVRCNLPCPPGSPHCRNRAGLCSRA